MKRMVKTLFPLILGAVLALPAPAMAGAGSMQTMNALRTMIDSDPTVAFLEALKTKNPRLADSVVQARIIRLLEENRRLLKEIRELLKTKDAQNSNSKKLLVQP